MDFTLSKKHEMARTLFKEFAEKEVKPLAQEVDETEEFPRATVEKMAKLGFLGIPVPKEYGGQGCDPLCYAMCVEELSKVCATTGVIVSAHTSLCIDPIMTYGTEEQKEQLLKVIQELRDEKGCLMPIMQKAQDIYGYLPYEVQKMISDELDVPMEKIYGVATFYSQFNLYPKGQYKISVCLGTACYVKGSGDIYNKLMDILGIAGGQCTADGKFSLDACRCIGACGLAPVMMINDDVYGRLTPDELDGILAKYM